MGAAPMIREPVPIEDDAEAIAALRHLRRSHSLMRAAFKGSPYFLENRDTGNAVSPRVEVPEAVVERLISAGLVRVSNAAAAWKRRNGETVEATPWRVMITEAGELIRRRNS